MKSHLLSIGNFVKAIDALKHGKVIIIESGVIQLDNKEHTDDERDIIGIPINDYWLEKLGFKKIKSNYWRYSGKIKVPIRFCDKEKAKLKGWYLFEGYKISYVHQLQNVINALS
ncbi:MAG TPA: hypothetical protein VFQ86_10645 [Arachidicoccus soli]|uniref:Uncharacterized protein n=1 Tax=Arachidicoccus soli TaxID=2341117 RepID=A0A386HTS2_9BACT|nr:hypothetical protein [Arachidicoccus soli]AYD49082.1 hypothetical protein D6B99_16525 [Arachidicoccus soli]HEU0228189.1 hypothetical protein [Arachidicoccus soli]